jgi:hypothetical protein
MPWRRRWAPRLGPARPRRSSTARSSRRSGPIAASSRANCKARHEAANRYQSRGTDPRRTPTPRPTHWPAGASATLQLPPLTPWVLVSGCSNSVSGLSWDPTAGLYIGDASPPDGWSITHIWGAGVHAELWPRACRSPQARGAADARGGRAGCESLEGRTTTQRDPAELRAPDLVERAFVASGSPSAAYSTPPSPRASRSSRSCSASSPGLAAVVALIAHARKIVSDGKRTGCARQEVAARGTSCCPWQTIQRNSRSGYYGKSWYVCMHRLSMRVFRGSTTEKVRTIGTQGSIRYERCPRTVPARSAPAKNGIVAKDAGDPPRSKGQ